MDNNDQERYVVVVVVVIVVEHLYLFYLCGIYRISIRALKTLVSMMPNHQIINVTNILLLF